MTDTKKYCTECTNGCEKCPEKATSQESSIAMDICKSLNRKNKALIAVLSAAITGWAFTIAGIILYFC